MMTRSDRNDIEELLFAIMNAGHAEYHLLELITNNYELYINRDRQFINAQIDLLRDTRRSLMENLEAIRPNVGPLWCTLKHMLLLYFHLIEIFERNKDIRYLNIANKIWDNIGNLLKDKQSFLDYQHCAICNQDRANDQNRPNNI